MTYLLWSMQEDCLMGPADRTLRPVRACTRKSVKGLTLQDRRTPRTAQCPLRSESDRIAASPRNVAMGQGTKSLRDSPLRGGLPQSAVTKGEIVDSGHVGLS